MSNTSYDSTHNVLNSFNKRSLSAPPLFAGFDYVSVRAINLVCHFLQKWFWADCTALSPSAEYFDKLIPRSSFFKTGLALSYCRFLPKLFINFRSKQVTDDPLKKQLIFSFPNILKTKISQQTH